MPERFLTSVAVQIWPLSRRFLRIVAEADQAVAGDGLVPRQALQLAQPVVVVDAGLVAADQHLIGGDHGLAIDLGLRGTTIEFVVAAVFEIAALADFHRHADDRIVGRLAVDFGQHDVGIVRGEIAGALHRRQLERIAEDQHLGAEAQQVVGQRLVDHRDLVDDDEIGGGGLALGVEREFAARPPSRRPACRSANGWSRRRGSPSCA